MADHDSPTAARTVQRILDAARKMVGDRGIDATQLMDIALAAGVPIGLLRYHFRSMEHLMIEAQRATFRRIHERFEERFERGETGVNTAIEALDALWEAVFELREWAPFMVQTMSLAARDPKLGERLSDFNAESLTRVELGLVRAFPNQLHLLVLPPHRLARAIRTGLYGLVAELAAAKTEEDQKAVAQTYLDVRDLLLTIVLEPEDDVPVGRDASVH